MSRYMYTIFCRVQERRVVICESMVSPRALREAVAHVLFRYLQVNQSDSIHENKKTLSCVCDERSLSRGALGS